MRAQALLDWSLKVELAEGLHGTIAYFDQKLRRGERRRTDVHPRKGRVSLSRLIPEEMMP